MPAPARAVLPLRSRHGSGVLVGAGQIGSGTLLVAPSIAIDESRVSLAQGLVVETEPGGRAGLQFSVITSESCSSLSKTFLPSWFLRFNAMLYFHEIHTQTHVRTVPIFVVQRVDLDDIGPEVGERTPGEWPRHPEPEVEDPDAGQGVREPLLGPESRSGAPMGGTGLGEHLLGVLTRPGRRPGDGPRRRRELQQWPSMVNEPDLGIVDLDHAAIGEERLVRERLARRPDRGHPKPRFLPGHPLVGGGIS